MVHVVAHSFPPASQNPSTVIPMPCSQPPLAMHMEPNFTELLPLALLWEEEIGWPRVVENVGESLGRVM